MVSAGSRRSGCRDISPEAVPHTELARRWRTNRISKRGHASRAAIDSFLAVGFTKPQVMELLMAVRSRTVSNYLDHINPAPLDAAFASKK
jgi:hypothetical protein